MSASSAAVAGHKRPRAAAASGAGAADAATTSEAGSSAAHTVYAEGLPYTATEADIRKFFDGCGEIMSVRARRFHDSGRLRGYAHVDFKKAGGVTAALARDGAYLGGRFISVAAANPVAAATTVARPRPSGCATLFVKG